MINKIDAGCVLLITAVSALIGLFLFTMYLWINNSTGMI